MSSINKLEWLQLKLSHRIPYKAERGSPVTSGNSFGNFLSDFQKQETELQISWIGGSTNGTIVRICEDCIVVGSVGAEAGFVHVIPLNNITSVRVNNPDQAIAITESAELVFATEDREPKDESPGTFTIKPLK